MKILACFKISRDFEHITPPELCLLRDGTLDISFFKKIIGSYDEAALENARRLAGEARRGGDCALHAITVGECEPRFAKELYAVGFDKVFRADTQDDNFAPEVTALTICAHVQKNGGYDAILTGRQAWPGESGLTPYIIANLLSLPCIPHVTHLELCEGKIKAASAVSGGIFTRVIKAPAVYIMDEAAHPYLKVATLREKLAASDKGLFDLGCLFPESEPQISNLSGTQTRLIFDHTEKQCRFIEGASPQEKAEKLWREVFS